MVAIDLWERIVEKDHSGGKSNRNARILPTASGAGFQVPIQRAAGRADNRGQNPAARIYG